jgi:hypothetical protein
VAVEYFIGQLGKLETVDFAAAVGVEQANIDARCVR